MNKDEMGLELVKSKWGAANDVEREQILLELNGKILHEIAWHILDDSPPAKIADGLLQPRKPTIPPTPPAPPP